MARRAKKTPYVGPTEAQEQAIVATWLDLHGVFYTGTANGARTGMLQAMKLKRTGCKPGVPDLLIFGRPTNWPGKEKGVPMPVGVAIEMKRTKGGVVSAEQRAFLLNLERLGWIAVVARGADEAIRWLSGLGYGQRGGGRD